MNKDELKTMECTSIEDLTTEYFDDPDTEERNAFKANRETFIISEQATKSDSLLL